MISLSNLWIFRVVYKKKSAFVNIEKVTQKQVKLVLTEKKLCSLKETSYKYKMKYESIHHR